MNQKKLIIFDVDGVIVDSFDLLLSSIGKFITEKNGKELIESQFRSFFDANALKEILSYADAEMDDLKGEDAVKRYYGDYAQSQIFPEIKKVIDQLATKSTLAVVTSTVIDQLSPIFEREGLSHYFAAFLGPRTAISKKKKLEMVMEEFGFTPEQSVYITDTAGDVKEAHAAGMQTIGVSWGYQGRTKLEDAGADAVIDKPEEILSLLTPSLSSRA